MSAFAPAARLGSHLTVERSDENRNDSKLRYFFCRL
jgi:hypothetical protein